MKKFADFAQGIFFSVATLAVIVFSYLIITEWQPYWRQAFDNFIKASNQVPQAIERVESTMQVATDTLPPMLAEMEQMTDTMALMQIDITALQTTVDDMNGSVENLSVIIPYQMDVMNRQMGGMNYSVDRMRGNLKPSAMMPWNW